MRIQPEDRDHLRGILRPLIPTHEAVINFDRKTNFIPSWFLVKMMSKAKKEAVKINEPFT